MKLRLEDLTTDRKWRSSTGLDKLRFNTLLDLFIMSHKEIYGKTVSERNSESPTIASAIENESELLFFLLFSLKSGLTYDLLGLVTGMDGSNAKRHQEVGLNVLKSVFQKNNYAPKREFKNVEEFNSYFNENKVLIVDGTEQKIQRPKDEIKISYSGKKNAIR